LHVSGASWFQVSGLQKTENRSQKSSDLRGTEILAAVVPFSVLCPLSFVVWSAVRYSVSGAEMLPYTLTLIAGWMSLSVFRERTS
jgi:hypothetical protein